MKDSRNTNVYYNDQWSVFIITMGTILLSVIARTILLQEQVYDPESQSSKSKFGKTWE